MIDLAELVQLTRELAEYGEYSIEGGHVLIVDEDFGTRWTLRGLLRRKGCVVNDADTGRRAMEMLREGKYDVVILDVGLPDMSGLEVYAALEELSPGTMPVLISGCQGEHEEEIAETCMEGRGVFFEKPLDLDQLIEVVQKFGKRQGDNG